MVDVGTQHAGLLITFSVGLARNELPIKASAAHTEEDDREKRNRRDGIDGDIMGVK